MKPIQFVFSCLTQNIGIANKIPIALAMFMLTNLLRCRFVNVIYPHGPNDENFNYIA